VKKRLISGGKRVYLRPDVLHPESKPLDPFAGKRLFCVVRPALGNEP
jgi:hypothetical protein